MMFYESIIIHKGKVMADSIKQLTFNENTYPDVLEVVIKLSELEQRKPHDTARRLIVKAGQQRIKKLSAAERSKKYRCLLQHQSH
jgi:hypothetical protein